MFLLIWQYLYFGPKGGFGVKVDGIRAEKSSKLHVPANKWDKSK